MAKPAHSRATSRRTFLKLAAAGATATFARPGPAAALDAPLALVQALASLPGRQRAVLVLRYFADLPEAEVASILDCSLGTVKSSASRGLERLRRTLDPATALADDDTSR